MAISISTSIDFGDFPRFNSQEIRQEEGKGRRKSSEKARAVEKTQGELLALEVPDGSRECCPCWKISQQMGVSVNGGTQNGWFIVENLIEMDDLD